MTVIHKVLDDARTVRGQYGYDSRSSREATCDVLGEPAGAEER